VIRPVAAASLLLASACSTSGEPGGRSSPLHAPDLRLSELARSEPAAPELFKTYNPRGASRWSDGWPWKLDLSGVTWDQPRTLTAITPRHVVMANHFRRPVGKEATFHDRQGRPHRRRIQQVVSLKDEGLACDVAIGLLDRPLPTGVRSYPLPKPLDEANEKLRGATVLVTDQQRRLFFHRVDSIGPKMVRFHTERSPRSPHAKHLVAGDSGNPAFLLSRGELVLIETHSSGGPGAGPYFGDAQLQEAVRKAVAKLDPAFAVRSVALDRTVMRDAAEGRKRLPARPTRKAPAATPPADRPRGGDSPPGQPDGPPPRPRPRVVVPAQ